MHGLSERQLPFPRPHHYRHPVHLHGPAQDHAQHRVAGQNVGVKQIGGSRKPFRKSFASFRSLR